MFSVKSNLGVQSFCYRNFKPIPDLIKQIQSLGLSRAELSSVHIDYDNESLYEPTIAQFKAAGIQITSIGVQYFAGDAAKEEKWFRFAKAAGATMMAVSFRVDSGPEAYHVTEKLADKYDMILGIHNHGGYDWLGNAAMLNYVFNHTGERVGLCIDTAWCLQAGEDPVKWAEKFNARLYGAHIKDFTFLPTGKPQDVIVGTGNLKLKEFMALALKSPKLATVTLEYEGDVDNPNPKLKECVAAMNAAV